MILDLFDIVLAQADFVLAQTEAAPEAPAGDKGGKGGTGSLFTSPMFLVLIMFALMYFVMIRPQRKQQKAAEEMRNSIGVGDQIVTAGGIHGIVSGQAKSTVSVKVADGICMKFDRSAVAQVVSRKGGESTGEEAEAEEEEGEEEE